MIPYLPKQICSKALLTYLIALTTVSIVYAKYSMAFGYIILGVGWISAFFFLTNYWTTQWHKVKESVFVPKIFLIALILRLIWVVASYYYYIKTTGIPFEFDTADALGYHEEALEFSQWSWPLIRNYYFGPYSTGVSDVGYPLYLTYLYKLLGPSIIIPRIIKAFISAYTCVLIYKLASRTFGNEVGKMAAVMTALMPNLVIYCGYHLKETEMLFLEVAFLERLDYLIRSPKAKIWNIVIASLLAASLFLFRTVLGAAAVMAFATAALVSNAPSMKRGWKRAAIIGWGVLFIAIMGGGAIQNELESLWEEKDTNASNKRSEQVSRGNNWAMYATGSVMVPMALALPFATMVNVDGQYAQQTKHGGNYIRNFMAFFAFIAIYEAFRRKEWRSFAMIGAFVIAYLGAVALSGFSNSERFLLPGLPCLIMMWAYGISTLSKKTYGLLFPWCIVVFVMEFGWAFFKLGSRGLV